MAGVLQYIRSTQGTTTAPGRLDFSQTGLHMEDLGFTSQVVSGFLGDRWIPQGCSIAKLGPTPDRIECVAHAWRRFMWEREALTEACRMLRESVPEKERKLADSRDPRILLLLHQRPMVRGGIYRGCTEEVGFAGWFHSVFVVEAANSRYFLYREKTDWSDHQQWTPRTVLWGTIVAVACGWPSNLSPLCRQPPWRSSCANAREGLRT